MAEDGSPEFDDTIGGDAAASAVSPHWAHHDLVVLADGTLVAPAPDGGLLFIDPATNVSRRVALSTNEVHGLTVVETGGVESLWVADCGFTMKRGDDGSYQPAGRPAGAGPRAVHVALDGTELASIRVPEHDAYGGALFLPTAVAVSEVRHGGNGDVWVTDGYGAGLVHRFSADGALLGTLDGTTGAGRFDCPHSIFIDRRSDEPVLLVADRGNAQVQVFSLTGAFVRSFGSGELTSPSAFATVGDLLVIAELNARVVVVDGADTVVEVLGENESVTSRPGWPNALDDEGNAVRPPLEAGRFNSPHGLAVDAEGRLFVSEWLIGGRLVSIRR